MAEKKQTGQPKKQSEARPSLRAGGSGLAGRFGVRPSAKTPARVKLLVSIVNRGDEVRLKEVIDDFSVALTVTFEGVGTAHSQVLDYLGIGETEKTLAFSLIPEGDEDAIMREIRTKIALYLVGRGISFTVPLTGISEIVAKGLTSAAAEKTMEETKRMTEETRKYDLIVAAVAAGFADEAMEAARAVGAAGGTVIHAHSLANAKAEQFIGVPLFQEQDLLLILSKREGKLPIMQALFDKVGLKTQAGGIIFSVPVDKTAGISVADETADGSAQA